MKTTVEEDIRRQQIESFGRLMAGFSHEMKNHLGIIRESNGLIADLVEMGNDERSMQRVKRALISVDKRVGMVANLLHTLSGFVHRSDQPLSTFNVNDLINEEYILLERFGILAQIDSVLELGEGLPALYNDPALLQHVFFRIYVLCLRQLDGGDRLVIMSGQNGKYIEIVFRLFGNTQATSRDLICNKLLAAVKKLEGNLTVEPRAEGCADLLLAIPSLVVGSE